MFAYISLQGKDSDNWSCHLPSSANRSDKISSTLITWSEQLLAIGTGRVYFCADWERRVAGPDRRNSSKTLASAGPSLAGVE